jgi:hypothetical protein
MSRYISTNFLLNSVRLGHIQKSVSLRECERVNASLFIYKVSDDSDFLANAALDPGSHVELQHMPVEC